MASSMRLLLIVGAVLSVLDAPPLWAVPSAAVCTAGRFAVAGPPSSVRGELVVLADEAVGIGSVRVASGEVRRACWTKKVTSRTAPAAPAGKVKLTATIADCATMTGASCRRPMR